MGCPIKIKQIQLTILWKCCILLPKQLTPRKGTETSAHRSPPAGSAYETTPTPQGDGNSPEAAALPLPPETTYTPQGDGNSLVTALFTMSGETTYTPQGDENPTPPFRFIIAIMKHPPPARGRERDPLKMLVNCGKNSRDTPTPQGDGNAISWCASLALIRNNSHPARGRPFGKEESS